MAKVDILLKNEHKVAEMLEHGAHYREVGQEFGVSKDVVGYFCKLSNMGRGPNKNSEEDAARKIKEKSDGLLEYVSGYTIKENPVKVRCLVCGGEFERTFHNLTTKGRVTCPICEQAKREQVKRERERLKAERNAEAMRKKEEREAERARRKAEREAIEPHPCFVCGQPTRNPKYCCPDCRKKANYSTHEHRRRAKMESVMVDKDITLEGLFRRDNGVCKICGRRCNYEDYVMRGIVFIAGDWYPSIDHVIPLSQGGEHSWNNIQLAHRRCNYLKSDKFIEE